MNRRRNPMAITPKARRREENFFSWSTSTLDSLIERLRPLLSILVRVFWVGLIGCCLYIADAEKGIGSCFFAISCCVAVLIYPAFVTGEKGLPFFGFYVLQQWLIYSLPLLMKNETVLVATPESIWSCSVILMIHLLSAWAGWYFVGFFSWSGKTSRLLIPEISTPGRLLPVTLGCLFLSLTFEVSVSTGVYWEYLGTLGFGTFSLIKAIMGAVMAVGAFAGAFAIGHMSPFRPASIMYWLLITSTLLIMSSGLLLSAGVGICLSTSLGYLLGAKRVPFVFLGLVACSFFLLSEGKYSMREKYWVEGSNRHIVQISEIPDFYAEWLQESFRGLEESDRTAGSENAELSLFERIDNMQNLLYIESILRETNLPLLQGQTYSTIPALLIPRVFWPDKPRTHEGQIKLNVHFGRQTEEQTINTNISWGLLPEAVGNFGLFWGPLIIGLVLGGAFRLLQKYSVGKNLFSLEGIVCCLLLLSLMASFEMVASVWITSIFQLIISAIIAYAALKILAEGEAKTTPRPAQHRPS